jgi:hypothetical protein
MSFGDLVALDPFVKTTGADDEQLWNPFALFATGQ